MSGLALFGGTPVRSKPFPSWPVFDGGEEQALLGVLRSGQWWAFSFGDAISEDGLGAPSQVTEFQRAFASMQGARFGLACSTGTAALEIALKALGIGPGDEVIVPPYSFVATATAPLLVNAVPVFCDIDPDTYNLDTRKIEAAITPRTRAIIPVHFAGLAADMGAILEIAARRGLKVIEDAAHAHGGRWNGQGLGCLGDAGTFSFQASKNMSAGEGGLITVNDPDLARLCESYIWGGREQGRQWYEHFRLGWNYRLTEFQSAILIHQLSRLKEQLAIRTANARRLTHALRGLPGIAPLEWPEYATGHAFHLFILRFCEAEFGMSRENFLKALTSEGVPCSGGYAHPIYKNELFLKKNFFPSHSSCACGDIKIDYSAFESQCPNAEQACREAVWLEHRLLLGSEEDMDDIAKAIGKIYEQRGVFAQ